MAPKGKQVLDPNDADHVTLALAGRRHGRNGLMPRPRPRQVAGKTGTANENVDAWFCGYTMQIVDVRVDGHGPSERSPLENIEGVSSVYGGTIPAAIWHDFMSVAMQGKPVILFTVPSFAGKTLGPSRTVYPSPSPTVNPAPRRRRPRAAAVRVPFQRRARRRRRGPAAHRRRPHRVAEHGAEPDADGDGKRSP